MKPLGSSRMFVSGGLVLLSIFLFATTAPGQLTANPSIVSFGSVSIGSKLSRALVLSNTGSSNLTIFQARVAGAGLSTTGLALPLTLVPGRTVRVTTTFAPKASGAVSGSLALTYSVSRSRRRYSSTATMTVSLSGTGAAPGQLSANPTSLNFADVRVGNSLALMDSFTNTGGASVTISGVSVTGAGYSIAGLSVPLVLNPGASVTFSTTFRPQSAVSASGAITVTSNASKPTLGIALSGTGISQGQLSLTPTALDFGSVTVGTRVSQPASATASGTSVTISSASLTSREFSLAGISFPLTIAAGQTVPFNLTFAPQSSGAASATLSLISNAGNGAAEMLTGNGIAPPPPPEHSVSLSWTGSGSEVVAYNVYRGNIAGGPYTKIGSALDTTRYVDNAVSAGQAYCYVATALDGNGRESSYSNEVQAVIPSP